MTFKENVKDQESKAALPVENNLDSEKSAPKDYREDSILYRPRTETYETNKDDNTFNAIKKHNPSHAIKEQKRDELNRSKPKKNSLH